MKLKDWDEADLFSSNVIVVERKVSMWLFWLGLFLFYIKHKNITKKIYKGKKKKEQEYVVERKCIT